MEYRAKTALKVKNLSIRYRQGKSWLNVLSGISFDLYKGEVLTLLGESGSGKSTCGKALLGMLPPSAEIISGQMDLGTGEHVDLNRPVAWNAIRGKRIAMIYQDAQLALNPVMRIRDQFLDTLRQYTDRPVSETEQKCKEMLSLLSFSNPERILDAYPFELSGGMCQRVYIALILCLNPDVLIADEPTSALDVITQKEVLQLIASVKKTFSLSILLITHDIGVAYAMSDRVIVLDQGEIVEQGAMRDVVFHPQKPYTKKLVDARNLPPVVSEVAADRNEVLLSVKHLTKTFGGRKHSTKVLDSLCFDLYCGETLGILGASGCGKSTLARCLFGLEPFGSGEIVFRNEPVNKCSARQKNSLCRRMQLVFQDARASLNANRSALQLVQEPLKFLRVGTKSEREIKAKQYLDLVGLEEGAQRRKPPQLSTGQCQRIAIARALIIDPDLLVCDEAVSALDMITQKQILFLLKELQSRFGFAIVMISHDIRVLKGFCQRIAVMDQGKFCEVLTIKQIEQRQCSDLTCKLLDSELDLI